ncbi:MAG: DNA/RNA-binding protein AlbA [Candidatus Lokiarchaeota archaeon]|nr:DNA/RNA-binding protein AlbA [Candidatus Lokiarchaeota archaeon]
MPKGDDSKVFIGKKKSMAYVMAAMVVLNEKPVTLLARGRSISRAVDVAEILLNKFVSGASYGEIKIDTETITNTDGTNSNVSSIEIEINPPKK